MVGAGLAVLGAEDRGALVLLCKEKESFLREGGKREEKEKVSFRCLLYSPSLSL